ncbi:MAG: hypothetical protein J6D29_04375 [Solobacterium sp.]|nr:hypothetical protein [Solobacterium sp.]
MNINRDTKAMDLINQYPWLTEEIKKMGDAFKIIDSPLAKLFLKSATLGDICARFNLDETKVLEEIEKMIDEHNK